MADNYLERKMEEYRSGKSAAPRRRVIPSGAVRPQVAVPLGEVTVLIAGVDEALVAAFANAGAKVRFCNADDEAISLGRRLAERWGAQYFPYNEAKTLALLDVSPDYIVRRTEEGIEIMAPATGLNRRITLTADKDENGTAAAETLAVLFCTPLFSNAAGTVSVI